MPVCKALMSAYPEAASKACPVASAKGTTIKGKRTVAALAAEVNVWSKADRGAASVAVP